MLKVNPGFFVLVPVISLTLSLASCAGQAASISQNGNLPKETVATTPKNPEANQTTSPAETKSPAVSATPLNTPDQTITPVSPKPPETAGPLTLEQALENGLPTLADFGSTT